VTTTPPSLCLCLSLFLPLSVSISHSSSVSLFLSLSLSLTVPLRLSLSLSLCLSLSLFLSDPREYYFGLSDVYTPFRTKAKLARFVSSLLLPLASCSLSLSHSLTAPSKWHSEPSKKISATCPPPTMPRDSWTSWRPR
jgi:hypothetical protein